MRVLPLVVLVLCAGRLAAQDGLFARIDAAWRAERMAQAALLLDQSGRFSTAHDEARIWTARLLQGDDPGAGLRLLADGPWSEQAVQRYPEPLRGFWHLVAGELLLADDPDAAAGRQQLLAAIAAGGERVDAESCLARLCTIYRRIGQRQRAQRCAEALWHGWPGSPWRPWAGLQLADLVAAESPERSRQLLYAVLGHPRAADDQLRQARLRLCRMLLETHPQQVRQLTGSLRDRDPLMRAWYLRAGLALDLPGSRAGWEQLPPDLRSGLPPPPAAADPARPPSLQAQVQELLAAGDRQQARRLLRPYVEEDVASLRLWLELDGDPTALSLAALAADHRLALLAAAGSPPPAARELLEAALAATSVDEDRALLLAGLRRLHTDDEHALARIDERLRTLSGRHAAIGEAWVRLAQQRREPSLWEQAAGHLPAGHPWAATAAAQAALWRWRRWRAHGGADDLTAVQDLAGSIAWSGDTDAHLRCRFLLARVAVTSGATEDARVLLAGLRRHADARQEALLDRLEASLAAGPEAPPPAP